MISTIFVLLLYRGADFVGYSSKVYLTHDACKTAAQALPRHRGECIRMEIQP